MKSTIFNKGIVYFLSIGIILFSLLFLRSWHLIGPVSFRNFAAILLFFLAIRNTPIVGFSKNEKKYLTWLIVYLIINFISGRVFASEVYKNLIGYHLVSVILIFSIPRLITSTKIIKQVLIWFTVFYLINLLISWLQYNNDPVGWAIGNFVSPINEDKFDRIESMSSYENMLSLSVCSGLNGFVVTNGQFVAGFLPLASMLLWGKKKISNIVGFVIAAISIFIAFCIQQRMCFFITLLYVVIFFAFRLNGYKKILILGAALFGLILLGDSVLNLDAEAFGRLFLHEDGVRSHTGEMISAFLLDPQNLLLGNPIPNGEHDLITLALSHNCILDSIRRGGVICFLLFIILYFSLFIECFKVFKDSLKESDYLSVIFSVSTTLFLLYSLTHSSGIPSGDVFTWFSYSFMFQSYTLNSIETKSI